jgi:hypothetical protein
VNEIRFRAEMKTADTLRRHADDPLEADYYAGFIRGLRRSFHGDVFGTAQEHESWMAAADDTDESRAKMGQGYRAAIELDEASKAAAALGRKGGEAGRGEAKRRTTSFSTESAKKAAAARKKKQ